MTVQPGTGAAPALTARGHALRVSVLDALTDTAAAALKKARDEARPAFAAKRLNGDGDQQTALLPDGTEVGLVSIKAGVKEITPDEEALEAFVAEHCPGELEDYVDPDAWGDTELIELIRAAFPRLVKTRVRAAARKKLLAKALGANGWLVDEAGEKLARVGDVTTHLPTGDFAYKPRDGAAEAIVAQWLTGDLEVPGMTELLALPPGKAMGGGAS